MKVYVHEQLGRNSDGDLIMIVNTYHSEPHKFSYIVWVEK